MVIPDPVAAPAESVDAAKVFLRLETDADDAALAAFAEAAIAQCESFLGEALFDRSFTETIEARGSWTGLTPRPVTAITAMTTPGGTALLPTAYETDIDPQGVGRVRLAGTVPKRVRVSLQAGRAVDWNGLPEPIRQGIVRLIAWHWAARDGGAAEVPRAVEALWRGARRMRLS